MSVTFRNVTPDFSMLTGTERSVDLIRLDDGREGAVLRMVNEKGVKSSWHLVQQDDGSYLCVYFADVYEDTMDDAVQWYWPADAAIQYVETVIAAL